MTAQTEAPAPTPSPAPPVAPPVLPAVPNSGVAGVLDKFMAPIVPGLIASAIADWGAGVAARYGFHGSLPFLPTWLMLIAALLVVGAVTYLVASHWHAVKVAVAPEIAAKTKLAEGMAEHIIGLHAAAILSKFGV
jgi:hypothetical protein